jgi:hypothetical protein
LKRWTSVPGDPNAQAASVVLQNKGASGSITVVLHVPGHGDCIGTTPLTPPGGFAQLSCVVPAVTPAQMAQLTVVIENP